MNLEFINALKNAASTVSVVTTNGKKGMAGATISSFCSVSANPASLLACVFKETPLSSTIKSNKKFCLNLLSLEQINISNIFAGREVSTNQNKFDLVDWNSGKFNQPIIKGSVASFECDVSNIIDGKTHNVFFGNVIHSYNANTSTRSEPLAVPDPLVHLLLERRVLLENLVHGDGGELRLVIREARELGVNLGFPRLRGGGELFRLRDERLEHRGGLRHLVAVVLGVLDGGEALPPLLDDLGHAGALLEVLPVDGRHGLFFQWIWRKFQSADRGGGIFCGWGSAGWRGAGSTRGLRALISRRGVRRAPPAR